MGASNTSPDLWSVFVGSALIAAGHAAAMPPPRRCPRVAASSEVTGRTAQKMLAPAPIPLMRQGNVWRSMGPRNHGLETRLHRRMHLDIRAPMSSKGLNLTTRSADTKVDKTGPKLAEAMPTLVETSAASVETSPKFAEKKPNSAGSSPEHVLPKPAAKWTSLVGIDLSLVVTTTCFVERCLNLAEFSVNLVEINPNLWSMPSCVTNVRMAGVESVSNKCRNNVEIVPS